MTTRCDAPCVLVCLAAVAASAPRRPRRAAEVPDTSCEVFPADNAWHLNVGGLPVHPRNDDWSRTSHARHTLLHPDFGPPSYGIPFDVVGAAHQDVAIDFRYAGRERPGPLSVRPGHPRRGRLRPARADDRPQRLHALRALRRAMERWEPEGGQRRGLPSRRPHANELRPAGWTSADAAGLPIFAGLLRVDEVAGRRDRPRDPDDGRLHRRPLPLAGAPLHRHGRPATVRRWAPASGFARGSTSRASARRLAWCSRRFKTYGLIVADNGSDWYFQGTVDDRWTNAAPRPAQADPGAGLRRRGRDAAARSRRTRRRSPTDRTARRR